MKKRLSFGLSFIGLILGLTLNLGAQSGFYLGLTGGCSAQKPSLPDFKFDQDTSFIYGARVGLKFLMFAVEGVYFQAAHTLKTEDLSFLSWANRQVDTNFLGLQVKYFMPILMVHPYLSLGYGYFGASIKDIDQDHNGGWNVGAGIEVHLGKKFALLGEGRYFLSHLDISNEEMKFGQFVLTGGINIYF
jgi:opacity protein-like surface antigen